ncbi:sterol regulatory element binding protein cleavage-activating protein [Rhodocollybia butyracea]|uniref:Sterol regulatory element-binding protein cleavage-activating protein n=1 Tax=Rhodocollybia butyracea TaxID=206335 RepID=A0A9P5PS10_9AGAR|nr:sterol regulatory element binding protein cleavage-activating protein [Rhodocollybia butyracea]
MPHFSLLQFAITYSQRFFIKFGLHCATHQIRIILVSCVVITSLFYPALALYSSQAKSISIFDVLISPNSSVHAQHDLADLWSGYDSLRSREDAVSRAQCGNGRTIRVERLLVQSSKSGDHSALNHGILFSTLNFERRLEQSISSSCIRNAHGGCFVLSPLEFWGHDREALLMDTNILDNLAPSKIVSIDGIPISPGMVLAGRSEDSTLDFANFLALTYFFPQSGCFSASEHAAWLQAVRAAVGQEAEVRDSPQEPTIIALEFGTNKSRYAISVFLYLSYAIFFVYVFWSMRQMKSVHSRVGIAFTALVEIVVSTITSLSVCALVGFKVTMVPWELLPIVIVFVGAENMFNLVDAVGRTSVTLTVKQRIAEGLSRAGTSNTLKVVSYNSILGVLAVYAAGSIRQFCVFAIVVLVAHWFLAHTFFLAVLSIDMQRLELEELIRQDSGLALSATESSPTKPNSSWRILTRKLFRGRATKNLSLFLLLAITATLYYITMPASSSEAPINPQATPHGALFRNPDKITAIPNKDMGSDSRIWNLLNPTNTALHIRIEAPTFLTLRPNTDSIKFNNPGEHKNYRSFARTLRTVFWLGKIMVLPIAATTFLLWLLCLYLLKDTELLDAQQNRAEPPKSSPSAEELAALERHVSFSTLPRTFSSDVELIATSSDGRVAMTVGLHNEVTIWRTDLSDHFSIDVSDILLQFPGSSSASSTLTSVAMDDDGDYCAVGTGAGVIAVWDIRNDNVRSLPQLSLPDSSAGVVEMQFIPRFGGTSPPISTPASPVLAPLHAVHLVAVYESGAVAKYAVKDLSGLVYIKPSHSGSVVRSKLVRVKPENRLVVAFCLNDGFLELFDAGDSNALIPDDFCVQAGNLLDIVTTVHIGCAPMAGEKRVIIATATEAGIVSLWDGHTGDCIRILEEAYGRINQLRVSLVPAENCRSCGHLPSDSFLLSFSVDHVVRFFKQFVTDGSRRCSCASITTTHRKKMSMDNSLGGRSRASSISSVGSTSPMISQIKKFTNSDVSPFPVSGHGVHSRRASEKESNRRVSGTFSLQIDNEDSELRKTVGPREVSRFPSLVWQDAYIIRVGDTTCDRGGWDIYDGKIIGVRRKSRGSPSNRVTSPSCALKALSVQGLSMSTLDRWEIWSFDPCTTLLQSSPLSSVLVVNNELDLSSPSHLQSSASYRSIIPRLPFTRVTPFIVTRSRSLAGFGNTLGVFDFLKL